MDGQNIDKIIDGLVDNTNPATPAVVTPETQPAPAQDPAQVATTQQPVDQPGIPAVTDPVPATNPESEPVSPPATPPTEPAATPSANADAIFDHVMNKETGNAPASTDPKPADPAEPVAAASTEASDPAKSESGDPETKELEAVAAKAEAEKTPDEGGDPAAAETQSPADQSPADPPAAEPVTPAAEEPAVAPEAAAPTDAGTPAEPVATEPTATEPTETPAELPKVEDPAATPAEEPSTTEPKEPVEAPAEPAPEEPSAEPAPAAPTTGNEPSTTGNVAEAPAVEPGQEPGAAQQEPQAAAGEPAPAEPAATEPAAQDDATAELPSFDDVQKEASAAASDAQGGDDDTDSDFAKDAKLIKEAASVSDRMGEMARIIAERFPAGATIEPSQEGYDQDMRMIARMGLESISNQIERMFQFRPALETFAVSNEMARRVLSTNRSRIFEVYHILTKENSEIAGRWDLIKSASASLPQADAPEMALTDLFALLQVDRKVDLESLTEGVARLDRMVRSQFIWTRSSYVAAMQKVLGEGNEPLPMPELVGLRQVTAEDKANLQDAEGAQLVQISDELPGATQFGWYEEKGECDCLNFERVLIRDSVEGETHSVRQLTVDQLVQVQALVDQLSELLTASNETLYSVGGVLTSLEKEISEVDESDTVKYQVDRQVAYLVSPLVQLLRYGCSLRNALTLYAQASVALPKPAAAEPAAQA